jgi:hypothetical protein
MPGTTPAMKSRATEVSVSSPYTMNAVLGGISTPRVPPAATAPIPRRMLRPRRLNSGSTTPPIAPAVATLEPDIVEKAPQAAMAAL